MALKEYSLGFRRDGTRIQSSVAAYSTMLRDLESRKAEGNISAGRCWFKTDPRIHVSDDGMVGLFVALGSSPALSHLRIRWRKALSSTRSSNIRSIH